MKQRLGAKKHKLCEAIGGRTYRACYTSGHYGHGVAECWYGEGERVNDADRVNYLLRTVQPKYRDGRSAAPAREELLRELADLVGGSIQ